MTDERYKDAQWLREKYHGEKKSLSEIGDMCGVCKSTILYWVKKFDIPRRTSHQQKLLEPAPLVRKNSGHLAWHTEHRGTGWEVAVHQLAAIAWEIAPAEDVFGGGMNIHHDNHVPWDNREENLEALSRREHMALHSIRQLSDEERERVLRLA